MKLKKEYFILLLVIVALSFYLAMRSKDQTHFELPQLSKVEVNTITRLVITPSEGDAIELNKKDDQWHIAPQQYLANSIKVGNMVKAAGDLAVTALVSESENYQRYDLDDGKKINLQALAGKDVLRKVDIGRVAPTNQHTFVRLDGDAKVYHATGNIHRTFNQTVAQLRDETVLTVDKEAITFLSIEKAEHSLALNRKEAEPEEKKEGDDQSAAATPKLQWQDADGQVVDTAAVNKLIAGFANVKCNGYLADEARQGLKEALWTVSFKAGDKTQGLSLFAPESPEADKFPASSTDNEYAFLLDKSRVETFEKQIDALLKIEPPAEKQKAAETEK